MRHMWAVAGVVVILGLPAAGFADGTNSVGVGLAYGGVGYNHEGTSKGRVTGGFGVGFPGVSGNLNVYLTGDRDDRDRPQGARLRLTAGVLWLPVVGGAGLTVGGTSPHWDWGVGVGVIVVESGGTFGGAEGLVPLASVGYRF